MNMLRPGFFASAIFFAVAMANAQSQSELPCQALEKRPISFTAAKATEILTVEVGKGPCINAPLTLKIQTNAGKVLYLHKTTLQHQEFFDWDKPSLPSEVDVFVKKLAASFSAPVTDVPTSQDLRERDPYILVASRATYHRLLKSKQPIFHHQTYYEGGKYVTYDPLSRRSLVLIEWGL